MLMWVMFTRGNVGCCSEVKRDFQDIEGTLFDFLCREDGKLSLGQFLTVGIVVVLLLKCLLHDTNFNRTGW